jgi:hypothetical protein
MFFARVALSLFTSPSLLLPRYIPCTGTVSTTWFTCMKPTQFANYPLYSSDYSTRPSTVFKFPKSLYVEDPSVSLMSSASEWIDLYSTQYVTMIHYCDRYGAEPGDSVEGTNGWKPGKLVECENDNMP